MKTRLFRPGLFGWSDAFFGVGLVCAAVAMATDRDALWKATAATWALSLIFEIAAKLAGGKAGDD